MLNKCLSTAFLIIAAFPLHADYAEAYLDASGGYRRDTLSAEIHSFNSHNILISKDMLNAKDLSLFQLGGKGLIGICDFYVRGEAFWGWSDKGKYKSVSKLTERVFTKSKSHLHDGKTKDFSVGIGYFFPFCAPLVIGSVGGWSYQSQEFKVKKARFITQADGSSDASRKESFEYNNHWQGPWLGIDSKFRCLGFDLRAGYSYHWAKWDATWSLKNRSAQKLISGSNRKSADAHGQVAYLDFFWGFCPFIDFGVGFKWQQWQAKKGKKKSLEVDELQIARDQLHGAKWESFTASVDLGVSF